MSLLKDVLSEMPKHFNSNQFARCATSKGLPSSRVADGAIAEFLKLNALRGATTRTWKKKQEPQTKQTELTEIEMAVNLLKRNGYKVLQPFTEYREL